MLEPAPAAANDSMLGLLLRLKGRTLFNRLQKAVHEAPVRLSATVLLLVVIWIGFYGLFYLVFRQLRRTPLEATVAIPLLFNVFFIAMLVLLTVSNAIIAYGAIFGRKESAYLLASPLTALDLVTIKFLESLVAASWSLVVLGFPLMMAMADLAQNAMFYWLFLAFFLAFIPIPTALGLVLAWAAARWFPRRLTRGIAAGACVLAIGGTLWALRSLARLGESATEAWLRGFLARMSFVEAAFLPNHWVASGIDHAVQDRYVNALWYLGVTVANAAFLSWLAVRWVAAHFEGAYDRASAGRDASRRHAASASGGLIGTLFFYLPLPLRLIAAKDLRTFFRDPLQWSQLAILFALLGLYLTNTPTLTLRFSGFGWDALVPFLNLSAISLILATFTCRFVFPLVSLEGQNLWLVGLLPVRRGHLLRAKLAFALSVTLLVALSSMLLAATMLNVPATWMLIHLGVTIATCLGLCGLAVGVGARLPMFGETNAARIANGLGGTTNLLLSVTLVMAVLLGIGVASWRSQVAGSLLPPDTWSVLLCLLVMAGAVATGWAALRLGARHLERLEV